MSVTKKIIKNLSLLVLATFWFSCAEQKAFSSAETRYSCECNELTLINDSLYHQKYQAKLICYINLKSKPKSATDTLVIESFEPSVLLLYKDKNDQKIRIFGNDISRYVNYNEIDIQNRNWKISHYESSLAPQRFQYGFTIHFLQKSKQ